MSELQNTLRDAASDADDDGWVEVEASLLKEAADEIQALEAELARFTTGIGQERLHAVIKDIQAEAAQIGPIPE
jgi:hypothetical protein